MVEYLDSETDQRNTYTYDALGRRIAKIVDADVTAYIEKQEEHQYESFKDEFRRLCKQHGVEIDKRYVWD